tara:strand:+ start:319 stop:1752 length:1434 start_codon:yes stop_codon:yes gene_type:complete
MAIQKLSVNALSEGTIYTDERVDDRVSTMLIGGNNITATYDDTAGTLTLDGQPGYTNSDVDTHLNQSTASANQYLKWNGSAYEWAAVSPGYTDSDVDTHLNQSTASASEYLKWNGSAYEWATVPPGYTDSDVNTFLASGTMSDNLVMGSGQLKLANLAADPSTPITGGMYYNTTDNVAKIYNGTSWIGFATYATFSGNGGNFTYNFTDSNNVSYRVHAFTSSGIFQKGDNSPIDIMMVGGGGGGGGSTAGGGGAGGLINHSLTPTVGDYSIIVGAGGSGSQVSNDGAVNNTNGGYSSAFGYTALGGGYGFSGRPSGSRLANSGGSGGGGGYYSGNDIIDHTHSGSGTVNQGNRGGFSVNTALWGGAGGGGASSVGIDQGSTRAGGAGTDMSSFFSTNFGVSGFFAGGGGGGQANSSANTPGGSGGGGQGGSGTASTRYPTAGTANTGGGGGGGGTYGPNIAGGGAGGSGIVLIRYEI